MLSKRKLSPRLLCLTALSLLWAASAIQPSYAAPQHVHHHRFGSGYGHGLPVIVNSRVVSYQIHGGSYRNHGYYGPPRHYVYRHGYGLGAVGLGILGGGILGAAIAHAGTPVVVNPAPVIYSHPLVVASSVPSPTVLIDPSQGAVQSQSAVPPFGTLYSALPAGCVLEQVQAQTYYRCGSYWYLPLANPH
ncbi:MAG: hypothetical protein EBX61_04925 [Betaproteobacteria bacterium]|nr:hypothetical protein [Betaproteobacteria bacterium]